MSNSISFLLLLSLLLYIAVPPISCSSKANYRGRLKFPFFFVEGYLRVNPQGNFPKSQRIIIGSTWDSVSSCFIHSSHVFCPQWRRTSFRYIQPFSLFSLFLFAPLFSSPFFVNPSQLVEMEIPFWCKIPVHMPENSFLNMFFQACDKVNTLTNFQQLELILFFCFL